MLTRAEIAAMTAPQLRLAVAENIMEWKWFWRRVGGKIYSTLHEPRDYNSEWFKEYKFTEGKHPESWSYNDKNIPDYPGEIGAADLVVAAMEAKGYRVTVSAYPGALNIKTCTMKRTDDKRPFIATAATRAEAISRCAMYATAAESEKE